MSNDVELPFDEGKALIVRTAMKLGYDEQAAKELADAAWWLENRSLNGVTQAIVYMILTRDMPLEKRKHKKHPDYGMECFCPIFASEFYVYALENDLMDDGPRAFLGPAAPLLFAPLITFRAQKFGKAIRLRYFDNDITLAFDGTWITNRNLSNWSFIWDEDSELPITSVELVDIDSLDLSARSTDYCRHTTLKFPKFRMRDGETLYLGD